jgi:choline kinase
MKAIILSAGQGRRLMPLTANTPKCCLVLRDKTLLEHQVEALAANGVSEVVVVTGFGHRVVENIVSEIHCVAIRTLYNPFYALSDNLGTSWVARNEMKTPFLLVNGDTLFEPATLARLLEGEKSYPITLATDHKFHYDADDMKISAAGEHLQHVGKKLPAEIVNGESIGMMVFDQAGADAFVDRVENLMAGTDGLARWYLSAIDELADDGLVGIRSINGSGWCEVDDLTDFAHAEQAIDHWQTRKPNPETRLSATTKTMRIGA